MSTSTLLSPPVRTRETTSTADTLMRPPGTRESCWWSSWTICWVDSVRLSLSRTCNAPWLPFSAALVPLSVRFDPADENTVATLGLASTSFSTCWTNWLVSESAVPGASLMLT